MRAQRQTSAFDEVSAPAEWLRKPARPANARGSLTVMDAQDGQGDQLGEAREAHRDPGEADVEAREAAVEAREAAVEAREAAHAERTDAANRISAEADARDTVSDDRDVAADKRENDEDRADLLDPTSDYGAHWPKRRNAQLDRTHAKGDRTASRDDRNALTEEDVEPDNT